MSVESTCTRQGSNESLHPPARVNANDAAGYKGNIQQVSPKECHSNGRWLHSMLQNCKAFTGNPFDAGSLSDRAAGLTILPPNVSCQVHGFPECPFVI